MISALDMEIKNLEAEMSAKNSLLQSILLGFENVLLKVKICGGGNFWEISIDEKCAIVWNE